MANHFRWVAVAKFPLAEDVNGVEDACPLGSRVAPDHLVVGVGSEKGSRDSSVANFTEENVFGQCLDLISLHSIFSNDNHQRTPEE